MVYNATFNNISTIISWLPVVLIEETGENHRPSANHWKLYHIILYRVHLVMSGNRTDNVSCSRFWLQKKLSIHPHPPLLGAYWVRLTWVGFELTTFVIKCTDCIGSCKSNNHTITTTTPFPLPQKDIGNHNAYFMWITVTVPLYRTSTSGVSLKKQPTVVIETKITCAAKNNSCILLRLRVTMFSLQQRYSNLLNRRNLLIDQQ